MQNNSDTNEMNSLDKLSGEYTKPDPGRLVDQKLISMIVEEILPLITGPEVLEMGFGDDQWTDRIIKKIGHSNVVDGSANLVNLSKEKYKGAITTYTSLFETFSPDKKFDTILASFVLEHVEDPVQVLKKSKEWLKENGKLIAIVPHAGSLHRRLAVAMGVQDNLTKVGPIDIRMGHRRVYDMQMFEKDLISAGYTIESKKGYFTKLLPQSMMSGMSDEMLKGFMELSKQLPVEYAMSIGFICSKGK